MQAGSVNDLIMAWWRKINGVSSESLENATSDLTYAAEGKRTHGDRWSCLASFRLIMQSGNTKKDKWFGVGWNTSYSDAHSFFVISPPFDSSHGWYKSQSLELMPAFLLIETVDAHTTFKRHLFFFCQNVNFSLYFIKLTVQGEDIED